MNTYELTIVLAGSMPEAKQKAILEKIKKTVKDSEGSIEKADEWGKKPLAYKIHHEKEGYYYYFELILASDRVAGVSRVIENDDDVLRQLLVVRSGKQVTSEKDEVKVEKKTSSKKTPGVDKKVKSKKIKKGKS